MRRVGIVALVLALAACGGSAASTTPTQTQTTLCEHALSTLYATLSSANSAYGQERFEAAVNAEAFNGTLPKSCDSLPKGQLMYAAKEASR